MKSFVLAVTVLVLISSAVCLNCVYISDISDHFLTVISEMPDAPGKDAENKVAELKEYAQRNEFLITLSIGHIETDNLFSKLTELEVRSDGNENDYTSALESLRDSVYNLRRSEGFSFKRIL